MRDVFRGREKVSRENRGVGGVSETGYESGSKPLVVRVYEVLAARFLQGSTGRICVGFCRDMPICRLFGNRGVRRRIVVTVCGGSRGVSVDLRWPASFVERSFVVAADEA